MKRKQSGINAVAWFHAQHFNTRRTELEKEADRNAEFYSGDPSKVFGEDCFCDNAGLMPIREDSEEEK